MKLAQFQNHVNWFDFAQVKRYAEKLGPNQVVYKNPHRSNYNITHRFRTDLFREDWVMHRTREVEAA